MKTPPQQAEAFAFGMEDAAQLKWRVTIQSITHVHSTRVADCACVELYIRNSLDPFLRICLR